MATNLANPQTDGFALDFGRLELDIAGKIYDRVQNISMSQPIEEGVIFGAAAGPIATTRGQMQIGDGTLELEFEQAVQLIEDLGDGWAEKTFSMSGTYRNVSTGKVVDMRATGCRLLDIEIDHSQGSDGLAASLPFSFKRRTINGKKALLE
jgi:hypothetical protein